MLQAKRSRFGFLWAIVVIVLAQAPFAIAALNVPAPYVLAPDGTTQQTLEEAGILNPDGRQWAIVLGKALFWDQQTGSDGNACASCHFVGGADTRLRNQINPGFNDVTKGVSGDKLFGSERSDTGTVGLGNMPSNNPADSNYLLTKDDMPLHRLQDETNRNSPIVTTTNDRISSLGAFDGTFTRVKILGQPDKCDPDAGVFHAGPYAARQVEPRNTPTVHNAVFFHRNFWDGRANNLFNGVGVFGMRDVQQVSDPTDPRNNNRLIVLKNGVPTLDYLKVENASLASQAVGPPTSDLEMSCSGRKFADVGRKLLLTIPLINQKVSKQDSVLGPYVSALGQGLKLQYVYAALIMKAFDPKYWAAKGRFRIVDGQLVQDPTGYSQMAINFSMFWGLSIMQYESTLVSDRSEFDALQAAGQLKMGPRNPGNCITTLPLPLDPDHELLLRGCTIFARAAGRGAAGPPPADGVRGGNCFICHNTQGGGTGPADNPYPSQPMLAEGTTQAGETFTAFLAVTDINGFRDLRDQGFANIGLRPSFSDRISGNTDPYGNPLSFGRQYWNQLEGKPDAVLDPFLQRAIAAGAVPTRVGLTEPTPGGKFRKLEVDGSSKAPILRNVALTPPYFSWGGYPSLRQVLKVYNRGMNRRDITGAASLEAHGSNCITGDDTGSGPDGNQPWPVPGPDCNTNTTGVIVPLGLSDCDAPVGSIPRTACADKGQTVANDDLAALERFLKSLTDRRVQCDMAPFDHPALRILNGHKETDVNHDGKADDIVFTLPAVGVAGYAPASGFCTPNVGDLFAPGMQSRSGGQKVPLQ